MTGSPCDHEVRREDQENETDDGQRLRPSGSAMNPTCPYRPTRLKPVPAAQGANPAHMTRLVARFTRTPVGCAPGSSPGTGLV